MKIKIRKVSNENKNKKSVQTIPLIYKDTLKYQCLRY